MKITVTLFLVVVFLSGCATYKFQRGHRPYDKGFVVSRDGQVVLEYTIGKNDTVPDELHLAKERFQRRRKKVEYFYRKMGSLENRLKTTFWDQPVMAVKIIFGMLRLPFIAYSDYRYQRNPQYRDKIDKIQKQRQDRQQAREKELKARLSSYILNDLNLEQATASAATMEIMKLEQEQESSPAALLAPTPPQQKESIRKEQPSRTQPSEKKKKEERPPLKNKAASLRLPPEKAAKKIPPPKAVKSISEGLKDEPAEKQPQAVIICRPQKGFSPLTVHFYGSKSYSPGAKIIAYSWDFGDGDTSIRPNPYNTYYSTSSEPRYFKVILTVTDSQGKVARADTSIEVLNK